MDLEAAPYEFLDLTDIDDSERNHLICTLYQTTQEDTSSLTDSSLIKSKRSPHGTTSATNKDNNKNSRYESTKYHVKNIAAVSLPQQLPPNEKTTTTTNVVRNLVIPRFLTPIPLPFCAVVKPTTLAEVAVVPLRQPALSAGAAANLHVDPNLTKGQNSRKAANQTIGVMAPHTSQASQHQAHQQQQQQLQSQQQQQQQQQQLVNSQSQVQQQQQQTQTPQQTSQNNNINSFPPNHMPQVHAYNQLPHNAVFMQHHGAQPAVYQMLSAPLPSNVYVNNVTANVNLHGYVTPATQYIPQGAQPAFMPADVQQNMAQHNSEQHGPMIQTSQPGSSSRGSRRGRGRGNGGNRRNEYGQRQQAATPEIVSPPVDPQSIGSAGYGPYYQYAYPQQFFNPPNMAHPQTQHATGTPLYLASHVPMYTGHPMYPYQQGIVYNFLPPEYPVVDEKGEEQPPPEGMMQQLWQPHMPVEYAEEYIHHEIVDDVNHNPSPMNSSHTPSLLSPIIPYMDPHLHSMDIHQHMSEMHIYETSSLSAQSLQSDDQIQDCQQHSLTPDHISVASGQNIENQNIYNNNEIIPSEIPLPMLVPEQTIHTQMPNFINSTEIDPIISSIELPPPPPPPPVNIVAATPVVITNNVPPQNNILVADQNENVPIQSPPVQHITPVNENISLSSSSTASSLSSSSSSSSAAASSSSSSTTTTTITTTNYKQQSISQEFTSTKSEEIYPKNIPTKTMSWTNQSKKTTASVAVTALPTAPIKHQQQQQQQQQHQQQHQIQTSNSNKFNIVTPSNVTAPSTPSFQQEPVPIKPNTASKILITAPSTNEITFERKVSQQINNVNQNENVKNVTTTSIASTVVPQQLQEQKPAPIQHQQLQHQNSVEMRRPVENITSTTNNVSSTSKLNIEPKIKKDEPAINNIPATVTSQPVHIPSQVIPAPVQPQQVPAPSTGPISWAGLFSNKSSAHPASLPVASSASSSLVQKKIPVAKVLPFEGTSNFAPTPPGTMSYSAASAQGLSQNQQNIAGGSVSKSKVMLEQANVECKDTTDEWSLKFADFLTKYKVDFTPVSLRPRGLTNRSNYCYINAILQALVGCPPLYNLMKSIPKQPLALFHEKTNIPTIVAMIELISEFSHLPQGARLNRREKGQKKDDLSAELQCDPAFEPTGVYKLWNASRSDTEGRQEDAEEFLGYVLNKLNDEMLEIMKLIAKPTSDQNGDPSTEGDDGDDWQIIDHRNKGSVTRQTDFGRTPLSDIFRGELRSRIQREGEHSTDVIQPFFTLQLNIEKAASVKEALEILVGKDQLEGVTCSKTNQEVVAWQQMTLEKLPVVLILHLKWFDYKSDGCTKIVKNVEFPVELKIDAKILGSKKYSQKQRMYKLFAVVYHDGKEATKGHYITDVHHAGYLSWLRFDDSSVKPVSENNVLRPRAPRVPYLLYYRRCDTVTITTQNTNNK